LIRRALNLMRQPTLVIDVDDAEGGTLLGEMDCGRFCRRGDAAYDWSLPSDEWNAIALNYQRNLP
jgi:fatty-acyl-CoA synthase